MSGHDGQTFLQLVRDPAGPALPTLAEYRGRAVTWLPWEPGQPTSMRLHHDMSCEHCGEDHSPNAHSTGTVLERRREVPARRRGYSYATTPETYQVRTLMAFRCTGCGAVDVVAHEDPEFWWTSVGPDRLSVGLMGRSRPAPARQAVPRPRTPTAPVPAPPASAAHRAAMREQFAQHLAAKNGPIV